MDQGASHMGRRERRAELSRYRREAAHGLHYLIEPGDERLTRHRFCSAPPAVGSAVSRLRSGTASSAICGLWTGEMSVCCCLHTRSSPGQCRPAFPASASGAPSFRKRHWGAQL